MKVDGLGVILAIILLPIILVVTYYIQLQVDTIAKENTYNTKLLNATYDAMSAFEINTANEELSSVADSMRSMILASNNVFLNSLATNLGISNANKEHLQQYIPAVLYTMYDGYYIYAPTETPIVAEKKEEDANGLITTNGYQSIGDTDIADNNIQDADKGIYGDIIYESDPEQNIPQAYTIHKDKANTNTDYILKSYVQYSARYIKDEIDVTINYTLDNYLNIVGTIDKVYYTKTGYLIKDGLVRSADIDGTYDLANKNEDEAKDKILGVKTNSDVTTVVASSNPKITLKYDNNSPDVKIEAKWNVIESEFEEIDKINEANHKNTNYKSIQTISEAETNLKKAYDDYQEINDETMSKEMLKAIQNIEYEIANYKAIAYYVSSSIFSNWVYHNLKDLTYGDIKDDAMRDYYGTGYQSTSGANDFYYDFHNDGVKTRKIFDDNEDPEKVDSLFNTHKLEVIKNSIKYNLNLSISAYCKMKGSKDFSLPILLDEEWDKILQNISIVSFMQGFDCGLKIYNNYEIVSSTNNELTVTPIEIYYVKKEEFNNTGGSFHRIDCPDLAQNAEYISFKSKEVKYDQIYNAQEDWHYYDHRNLACYRCINTNNYSEESLFAPNKKTYYDKINSLIDTDKKKAGYVSIAKERQNIYKTNALPVSEGYKIYDALNGTVSSIDLNNIKELQITIKVTANTPPSNTNRLETLELKISDNNGKDEKKDILLNQTTEQTFSVDVSDWTGNQITIQTNNTALPNGYTVSYTIQSVKAIYK